MRARFIPPLFIAGFLVVTIVSAGCGGGGSQVAPSDRDKAVAEAQSAFREAQGSGQDLSVGPCLAESLPGLQGWVADVAHDPRQRIDDLPANQCSRYREGDADHFVELGLDGLLIRAQ